MSEVRRITLVGLALMIFVGGCSDTPDAELEGFCDRAMEAVRLNSRATDPTLYEEEDLAELMAQAALASERFVTGSGPPEVHGALETIQSYIDDPTKLVDEAYLLADFELNAYAAANCPGLSISPNGTLNIDATN